MSALKCDRQIGLYFKVFGLLEFSNQYLQNIFCDYYICADIQMIN